MAKSKEEKVLTLAELEPKLREKYGLQFRRGNEIPPKEFYSTGSLSLDIIFGGGVPKGCITVFNGKQSVGKTATAYQTIATAQRDYPELSVGMVTIEPVDINWAAINGVDIDSLHVIEPDTCEAAIDIFIALCETREYSVLVFDSIGALIPGNELDGSSGDAYMLQRAKLTKVLANKTNLKLRPSKDKYSPTAAIFINHIYDKPDIYTPYVIAGGNAVMTACYHMATFLLDTLIFEEDIKADKKLKSTSERIGIEVSVKNEKNKIKGQQPDGDFRLFNQDGWDGYAKAGKFDNESAILRLGCIYPNPANPIIKKAGAWYSFLDKQFQGEFNARKYLVENPEITTALYNEVRDSALRGTVIESEL